MATRTLYLVRHGQHQRLELDASDEGLTREQAACKRDNGLTPLGIEQAHLTAQHFRSHPISAIYASSLPRTTQTADIIASAFPQISPRKSRGLWECIPCVPPAFAQDLKDVPSEVFERDKKHAENAFERYFKRARGRDKHEIIVCHGNLLRYFVCRVLQVEPEAWAKMDICNCGISEILVKPDGRVFLVSHNDVGHLPYRLTTCLGAKKHAP
jgi:serine/threonine-protein phosphatase PGAM5